MRRPHSFSLWKGIQVGWIDFLLLHLRLGNGKRIRFWHDVWCRDLSLKVLHPELYSIAVDKDASVHSFIMFGEVDSSWY